MKLRDGLILGLILGIGSVFLYTPKSGKQVRKEVQEKLNLVPKNFFNLLESLLDLSVSVLDFAKESLSEQSEKFSSAFNKGIDAAIDKTDELRKFTASIRN